MNIILFDVDCRKQLYPLTEIRPASELRVGITTIREKWESYLSGSYSFLTEEYLSGRYPLRVEEINLFIEGNILPTFGFVFTLTQLDAGEAVSYNGRIVAYKGSMEEFTTKQYVRIIEFNESLVVIDYNYRVFQYNGEAIKSDFFYMTKGHVSKELPSSNCVIGNPIDEEGRPLIFIEEGVTIECCILNVKEGPIYIGKNANIMEGSMIRGPFAADEGCVVNMGTKIYGATTLGPYCKVGGELSNVVLMAYSNKGHDGFLGNAVLGQWCNIGAGTSASNLKNDYTEVKLWNNAIRRFEKTGLQFCGLVMGDYSRIGVNVMLNTATMIGVGCNVYGAGFPRNFITSFQEGGASGMELVHFKKFLSTLETMMARRKYTISPEEKEICEYLFNESDT